MDLIISLTASVYLKERIMTGYVHTPSALVTSGIIQHYLLQNRRPPLRSSFAYVQWFKKLDVTGNIPFAVQFAGYNICLCLISRANLSFCLQHLRCLFTITTVFTMSLRVMPCTVHTHFGSNPQIKFLGNPCAHQRLCLMHLSISISKTHSQRFNCCLQV